MNKKERARFIQKTLTKLFPSPSVPLKHSDSYTLLIAVLLSAQSTDARVNQITPILFTKASTPQDMIKLSVKEIEDIIRPCGLGKTKAKAIWNLSSQLLEKHKGKVPSSFLALEALPGVGHKTASVVMSQAFKKPAFPVDTHIHRCAKRWGLSKGKNVKETEDDLKKLFPKRHWNRLHLQIIYFAREYCPARGHRAELCPICRILMGTENVP
jgi:endonuclease III